MWRLMVEPSSTLGLGFGIDWRYRSPQKILKQVQTCFSFTTRMDSPTGTRLDILELLLKQELSSQSLPGSLRVSPAAIRQHLRTLDALGLVNRRHVGTQPRRHAHLHLDSPQLLRAYPNRYA